MMADGMEDMTKRGQLLTGFFHGNERTYQSP